jgi:hypothetical protein
VGSGDETGGRVGVCVEYFDAFKNLGLGGGEVGLRVRPWTVYLGI